MFLKRDYVPSGWLKFKKYSWQTISCCKKRQIMLLALSNFFNWTPHSTICSQRSKASWTMTFTIGTCFEFKFSGEGWKMEWEVREIRIILMLCTKSSQIVRKERLRFRKLWKAITHCKISEIMFSGNLR